MRPLGRPGPTAWFSTFNPVVFHRPLSFLYSLGVNFWVRWRKLERTKKQSWKDPCGISQIVWARPRYPVEIVKILKGKGMPESTIYYQLDRGREAGGLKDLDDGRIGPSQRDQVKWAVLKVMGRLSPAGFYSDSSSTPGYGLEMVAHEVGLRPAEIEPDFYSVMHELRGKYLELGNSKDGFFSLFGWKQVEPTPNASYAPPD